MEKDPATRYERGNGMTDDSYAKELMAGEIGGKLVARPLRETFERKKPLEDYLLRLHRDLSQ